MKVVAPDAVEGAIDDSVAVMMLTQVDYRTGRLHDMAALTEKAHVSGVVTVWDLAHSAGALPVDLDPIYALAKKYNLRVIEDCHDLEQARALLLARCGINPAEETAAIAELAMENAQADVHLALRCAVCGHQWEAQFEAGVFIWKRVERLAADLIRQVHALARAYHWTEEAILAMPERRRARYLSTLAAEQNG